MEKSNEKKGKYSYNIRLFICLFFLILSGGLFGTAKYITGFSDWYYENVYEDLVSSVCRWISVLPFSLYEVIMCIFTIFILIKVFKYIEGFLKSKYTIKEIAARALTNLCFYISIFIFLNVTSQGINCFKKDFITLSGLEVQEVSEERLIQVCELFKDRLNELDKQIKRDDYGFLVLDKNDYKDGIENMNLLSEKYMFLKGFYPRPKAYIFSKLMSYQLLQGETTFTLEANYNRDMMSYNIPSTICHELSHIRGFNNEYEANYISFLACINSSNSNYKYSGYMMAYSYCMNDLYKVDRDAYNKINDDLSTSIKLEIREDLLYWRKYKGGISEWYNKIYNVLLKMGGQSDGIESYNNVVKLIISGYGRQF